MKTNDERLLAIHNQIENNDYSFVHKGWRQARVFNYTGKQVASLSKPETPCIAHNLAMFHLEPDFIEAYGDGTFAFDDSERVCGAPVKALFNAAMQVGVDFSNVDRRMATVDMSNKSVPTPFPGLVLQSKDAILTESSWFTRGHIELGENDTCA